MNLLKMMKWFEGGKHTSNSLFFSNDGTNTEKLSLLNPMLQSTTKHNHNGDVL